MPKTCFIDVETTGLNIYECGIYQIAGIIDYRETFDIKCRLFKSDLIEPTAFENSPVSSVEIAKYPDPIEAHEELLKIFGAHVDKYNSRDKMTLIGYNIGQFDYQMLRTWFQKCGDNYFGSWFWFPFDDIMVRAGHYLRYRRHHMPNFQLHTVAREFDIEVDETKLHDAGYDVFLTKEIYMKIEGNTNNDQEKSHA